MEWDTRTTADVMVARGVIGNGVRLMCRHGEHDGVCIHRNSGAIRYVIETNSKVTVWDDMIPAPEGMELEDVKKLVESILRLKGAA